jgi:hypothetical protein
MLFPNRSREPSRRFTAWLLAISALLADSCQQLDPNLATGPVASSGTGGRAELVPDGGDSDAALAAVTCAMMRTEAHDILSANCAPCHQAPGNPAFYTGGFNFILDLPSITSKTSPQSSSTVAIKYVVKGRPDQSYIYQRLSSATMPPVTRTQRPSAGDVQVIGRWITSCIDDPDSPNGWGPGGATGGPGDGGVTASALPACGPANVCPDGGCCVFSRCRPNGTTCGSQPNPVAGEAALPGLTGMCTAGSCQNTAGASCGKVNEPCCDLNTCTASQSSCLITDMTTCSACGGTGQPCCKPNGCLAGRACINGGVGRVGVCQVCGGPGQPCCGTGVAAQQTCNGTLTCASVAGMGNRCSSDTGAGGDGADGSAGADGAGGTAG